MRKWGGWGASSGPEDRVAFLLDWGQFRGREDRIRVEETLVPSSLPEEQET